MSLNSTNTCGMGAASSGVKKPSAASAYHAVELGVSTQPPLFASVEADLAKYRKVRIPLKKLAACRKKQTQRDFVPQIGPIENVVCGGRSHENGVPKLQGVFQAAEFFNRIRTKPPFVHLLGKGANGPFRSLRSKCAFEARGTRPGTCGGCENLKRSIHILRFRVKKRRSKRLVLDRPRCSTSESRKLDSKSWGFGSPLNFTAGN